MKPEELEELRKWAGCYAEVGQTQAALVKKLIVAYEQCHSDLAEATAEVRRLNEFVEACT